MNTIIKRSIKDFAMMQIDFMDIIMMNPKNHQRNMQAMDEQIIEANQCYIWHQKK